MNSRPRLEVNANGNGSGELTKVGGIILDSRIRNAEQAVADARLALEVAEAALAELLARRRAAYPHVR